MAKRKFLGSYKSSQKIHKPTKRLLTVVNPFKNTAAYPMSLGTPNLSPLSEEATRDHVDVNSVTA